MYSGNEFNWVPHNRSKTRKLLGLKQRVRSYSRSQVSPGADLPDNITDAADVCRTATMEGVLDEYRDFAVETLTNGLMGIQWI